MLQQKFITYLEENRIFNTNSGFLLAISGGVDSVVLGELCHQCGLNFGIAHMNFGLRGTESDEEEIFVRTLAQKYQVPIHVKRADTRNYADQHKVSVQVAARELRYEWFKTLLQEHNYDWLLTAHHAGDNIETMLMNFFRGTGISGLRGMLPVNGKVVRPLLGATREEIINFAGANALEWREDSSNASEKYSRNYFRHAIIPLVTRIFPEAEKNLLENIRRFTDAEVLYMQAVATHKARLLEYRGAEIHIPVLKLLKSEPLHTIVFEIVRDYGFTAHQVPDVAHLLSATQGKMVESATHRIFRNRKWIIIAPRETTLGNHVLITENDNEITFASGMMQVRKHNRAGFNINVRKEEAVLNSKKVRYPLLLRKWRKGDYFYPLGLGKKKKIARFLIDNKLSPVQKEQVWVVESDKKICWVVGMRIDDRFKVDEITSEVVHLKVDSTFPLHDLR